MNIGRISLVLTGFPVMALAIPVDERIDATPDGQVDVTNISGDIIVSGWDEDAVQVTGDLSEDAERLDFRREGDRVIVEVVYPENRQGRRNAVDDTDLIISIPRGASLDVETISADISVSRVVGEQYLKSVSGDIVTETAGSETLVESVSGDVRVTGTDAATRTTANAVSGDVSLDRISGEISVASVSGDIDSCFGPSAVRAEFGPPNATLRFVEGDSDASVEVSTMSGDIGLCR
jgi:hypothetical protein